MTRSLNTVLSQLIEEIAATLVVDEVMFQEAHEDAQQRILLLLTKPFNQSHSTP